MSFADDRLCPVCSQLDLQKVFDAARFQGLPRINTPESFKTNWTKYIQHVGDWRPPLERLEQYAPGLMPSCPFCEVVLGLVHVVSRFTRETGRVILAIPTDILYDVHVANGRPATDVAPASVFLLIMSPSQFAQTAALHFGNPQAVGGLNAWVRFAHREYPGTLVSVLSDTIVEPPQPLLELPMQGRRIFEERIDYGLVRSWIHLCESQHDTCRVTTEWKPIPHFKLIDCESRLIVSADSSDQRFRYVALSYVWGSAPPEKYTYPRLPDDLPPVVLDAMRVTMKLGFRYLWVDRYCIWQQDTTHKMSQVERMDQIYGDAELTVIAVGARDPGYGLPGLTLSRTNHAPITKRVGERKLVANFSHHWQLDQITRSKWATRGWTFQETCLSRRRLYFSGYEVSFECRDMMCFEHLTRPLAYRGSLEHHERPEWNHVNSPHGVWAIIQRYCDRQLTFSSDRLAAVSGVLRKWSRVNPGCSSYWGVPMVASDWQRLDADSLKRAFLAGLEWEVRSVVKNAARLTDFPSWSWVSQNGRTLFGHKGYFHLRPPDLVGSTRNMDAEVWIETPDGSVVDWATFCEGGGLDLSFTRWTRYLHIDCWTFQTRPLCHRQLKRMSGTAHDDLLYVPTPDYPHDGSRILALKFTPDFGYQNLATSFVGRELTAASFSPLEHTTFAIVLETVPGLTVRMGTLGFVAIADLGSHESQTPEDCPFHMARFTSKRCRIRLG
ncbi:hypothetical protein QIS74_02647 [Colletotrichum tabaci]|uniref:Heterokaryon incompatibility domain-containing protein n=1 Tax=Colletotrichum tabaci TaxID=1209068 RepID=A0AAV9TPS0_9PEZI